MFGKKSLVSDRKPVSTLQLFQDARRPKKRKIHVHKPPYLDLLIDVKGLQIPTNGSNDSDFERLDKLLLPNRLGVSDGEPGQGDGKEYTPDKSLSGTSEPKWHDFSGDDGFSLASIIVGLRTEQAKASATREKYKDREFPLPMLKKELRRRVQHHLSVVPKLLAGKEELSVFYSLAYRQQEKLPHTTMSSGELFDIPWHQFIAGFYGLMRQNYISQMIQSEHGALLRRSRNKTVVYWLPDMFATYVMAPEIIIRLVMEDMNLSKAKAEDLLRRTGDYGNHVADNTEMENDLAFGELEILTKGLKGYEKREKAKDEESEESGKAAIAAKSKIEKSEDPEGLEKTERSEKTEKKLKDFEKNERS